MKTLWTCINETHQSPEAKYRSFLRLTAFLFALAGLLLWLFIRRWFLSTWDWMVCFVLYPIILSWYTVFLYSCRHPFADRQ